MPHSCRSGGGDPGIDDPFSTDKIYVGCHGCFAESQTHYILGLDPFALFVHYEKGHLLCEGAISDQPDIYVKAMELILRLEAYDTRRRRKAMEKKSQAMAKGNGYGRRQY